jgi:hypothetical protein
VARKDVFLEPTEAHIKQLQEIGKQIRVIFVPLLEQQEQFQKAIQNAFGPFLEEQNKMERIIHSFELPNIPSLDMTPLIKQGEQFQKLIAGILSPAFERLQEIFRELPSRTREALILLGRHGWYLDLEMPLPELWELERALAEGDVTGVDNALIEYYEGRVSDIEKSIVVRFPKRQKLIVAAFNAHRRQEYELSIPVFLAQTDGICKEVFNEYLFLKYDNKPRTAIYVEQVASDEFMAALLSPLAQTLPIGASERQRNEEFIGLNRHMVLHGESLNYGNKINSLKAISLINYVAHVLKVDVHNSIQEL